MAGIRIDQNKCNLCGQCINACPFDAITEEGGSLKIGAGCKVCKLCVKQCPREAITLIEKKQEIDKGAWRGILVYAQYTDGVVHPVTYELIGKARELAGKANMPVYCLIVGCDTARSREELLHYDVDRVLVYDHKALRHFRVDVYANIMEDAIRRLQPSVVLIGGTSIGRSLAPRVAVRFRTGLTADCTFLDIKDDTDLVQIRPAFGGNIMAQIVTSHTRPQFATVRYKVMDAAPRESSPMGDLEICPVNEAILRSGVEIIKTVAKEKVPSITEASVLVVAGRGVKSKEDMTLIERLANLLGGQLAVTRPMVEMGWCDYTRQIGLSGRTVKPRLIITCGVSGAIQFTACMDAAERIVAINTDRNAPIFQIAHYGIVGDLYTVVPEIIKKIEGGMAHAV
jgi:electron transfer flavoprotein alpha subunit